MLQVEVLGEDGHVSIMQVESVIESPKVGDSYLCSKCKKRTTVKNVGVATRVPGEAEDIDTENQSSLLK